MGKETYRIEEYWHDEVTAYCLAFGILGERETPKEYFDQSTMISLQKCIKMPISFRLPAMNGLNVGYT